MSSLLEFDSNVLLDGAQGRIAYYPGVVAPELAREWLAILLADVPWESERRRMYDRDVDVPRLMARYALDRDIVPEPVTAAAIHAARIADCAFNSVGLNLYRDGNDSVAPHNDKLHTIENGAPIALLSLGATRRMTIASKAKPRRSLHLDLESGSILLMSYATQLHFDHGIPKTKAPVGPRISLAFRRRPRE